MLLNILITRNGFDQCQQILQIKQKRYFDNIYRKRTWPIFRCYLFYSFSRNLFYQHTLLNTIWVLFSFTFFGLVCCCQHCCFFFVSSHSIVCVLISIVSFHFLNGYTTILFSSVFVFLLLLHLFCICYPHAYGFICLLAVMCKLLTISVKHIIWKRQWLMIIYTKTADRQSDVILM